MKFSKKQAQTEGSIFLAKLYEDQIATFVKMQESLLDKLSAGTITAQAYESSKATYDSLIDQANKNLKKLSN